MAFSPDPGAVHIGQQLHRLVEHPWWTLDTVVKAGASGENPAALSCRRSLGMTKHMRTQVSYGVDGNIGLRAGKKIFLHLLLTVDEVKAL